jgi:hypothetical protein
MLSTLVSHNNDIKQLVDKGYAVSVDSNYLVVRDIPYLDSNGGLRVGAIVSKLKFVDAVQVKPEDHQIFFCGTHPCQLDGTPIANLGGGVSKIPLVSTDITVERSFSNKPREGFANLFEKIESYVTIISGPAMERYQANPLTFRLVESNTESVFNYADTLTSRSEIGDLSLKLKDDVVAIIGLGGTGAYILDFLVKTPVKEIRGFDLDYYHVHNAYRSPGKLEQNELGLTKAEVYQKRYGSFRRDITLHSKLILNDSTDDLEGVTFAFVCVDKGSSRAAITDLLISMNIPFIDVGMGLSRDNGPIGGTLRTLFLPEESTKDMLLQGTAPLSDLPDEEYQTNIQISELNALNACLAIIKYKKIRGFYSDDNSANLALFTLDNQKLLSE